MKDPVEKVLKEIDAGKVKPVYLLCGNQRFLYLQALERLLDALLHGKEEELGLIVYQPEKHSIEYVMDALATYSLFSSRTVVLIKDTNVFQAGTRVTKLWKKGMERWYAAEDDTAMRGAARMIISVLGKLELPLEAFAPEGVDKGLLNEVEEALELTISERDREVLNRIYALFKDSKEKPASPDDDAAFIGAMLARGIPEGNTLILTADKPDRRSALYKTIKKTGGILDYAEDESPWKKGRNPLLEQEIRKTLKKAGKEISEEVLTLLEEKVGRDAGKFLGELEKLIAFTGDRARIEAEDIGNLVSYSRVEKIFDISEALGKRDMAGTIKLMNRFFETESRVGAPLQLLGHIYNQVRGWLQARYIMDRAGVTMPPGMQDFRSIKAVVAPLMGQATEVAPLPLPDRDGETFLSDFYTGNPNRYIFLFRKAANYRTEELEEAVALLEKADLRIKSSGMRPGLILEQTLISICKGA